MRAEEVLAEQWRSAADVLRKHAGECDRLADEAEARGATVRPEIVSLLHQLDGHLGLAVHRGEAGSAMWEQESEELISRIRRVLKDMGSSGAR